MAQKDMIFRHSWTNPDLLPCGNIHWCAWTPSHLLPDAATSIKSFPSDVLFRVQTEEHILLFQDLVLFMWELGKLGFVFVKVPFLFFFSVCLEAICKHWHVHRLIPPPCLPSAITIPSSKQPLLAPH